MKYRKKPIIIEAVQWNGENVGDIMNLAYSTFRPLEFEHNGSVKINTLEGVMKANVGDYIIKGVKGEIYPCKPDIFEQTYEQIGEVE